MKRPYLLVLFVVAVFVSSCQKQNVQPAAAPVKPSGQSIQSLPASSILGKWNLVKDSTWSQGIAHVSINIYSGTSNDYYDFRTDGKCYKSENGVYDTISYKVASDTSVIFGDPVAAINAATGQTIYSQPRPIVIRPLTTHNATIFTSSAAPGGLSNRTVLLSK